MLPRLIVSDIEGCLTKGKMAPLEHHWISHLARYNRDSARLGLPGVAVCTGRSKPFAEAILQALSSDKPSVVENGCFVFDPGTDQMLPNPLIDRSSLSTMRAIRAVLEEGLLSRTRAYVEPCKEICLTLYPPATMSICQLRDLVEQEVPADEVNLTYSASAVDITPKGVDKGSGLRFLSQYTGVSLREMAGVGDSVGDLSFLSLVGISACPHNAFPDVKHAVNYVSDYCHARGVLDAIKYFTRNVLTISEANNSITEA